jgi:hypothetical protein
MVTRTGLKTRAVMVVVVALAWASVAAAMAPESKRLIRARDYIADEQWTLAIEQLRAAVDDPKEPRRDEALYWLAHSQHHSGDPGAAVQTIGRLERDFPKSMWVKPAQSLRDCSGTMCSGGPPCPSPRRPCPRRLLGQSSAAPPRRYRRGPQKHRPHRERRP